MKNRKRYYGEYGGQYIPQLFIPILTELEKAFLESKKDNSFKNQYKKILKNYVGRPTPLTYAKNLSKYVGAKVYLKREDLAHTGAHKINNTIGQALLAKYMGKENIIAETGAGQHGVATATAASFFHMPAKIFMGYEDIKRQDLNVLRMKLLGSEVVPVKKGAGTLKDAINEALRFWAENVEDTYYLLGSVVGPYPYPEIVKFFQSIIGQETKKQIKQFESRLPDYIIACVGGGSNAMGIFSSFIKENHVKLIAVEAAGTGINKKHSATLQKGSTGFLHGTKSLLLQNNDGQVSEVHSIAPGLDYPSVGPEVAYLSATKRITNSYANDKEVINAVKLLSELEGIIPALESAHAISFLLRNKNNFSPNNIIVVNISGRGDKDLHILSEVKDVQN